MALTIPFWWRKSVLADATLFSASTNAGAQTALRASAAASLSFAACIPAIAISSCACVHGAAAAEAGVGSVGDRARVRSAGASADGTWAKAREAEARAGDTVARAGGVRTAADGVPAPASCTGAGVGDKAKGAEGMAGVGVWGAVNRDPKEQGLSPRALRRRRRLGLTMRPPSVKVDRSPDPVLLEPDAVEREGGRRTSSAPSSMKSWGLVADGERERERDAEADRDEAEVDDRRRDSEDGAAAAAAAADAATDASSDAAASAGCGRRRGSGGSEAEAGGEPAVAIVPGSGGGGGVVGSGRAGEDADGGRMWRRSSAG